MTALEKWTANLAVNLKELAEIEQVAYKTACRWAKDPAFPRVGRFVRKKDFLKWWKGKVAHPAKASHRPPPADCISREQSPSCGLPIALPPKAARLRDAIASHS